MNKLFTLVLGLSPVRTGHETVIRFKFTAMDKFSDWWIVVADNDMDVCVRDPGKNVDIHFTTDLRTMIETWMGDTPYKSAIKDGRSRLVGPSALTRNMSSWLAPSIFDGIPPATAIQPRNGSWTPPRVRAGGCLARHKEGAIAGYCNEL